MLFNDKNYMITILVKSIFLFFLSLRQKYATFATPLIRERLSAMFSLSKEDNLTYYRDDVGIVPYIVEVN